MRWPEKRLKLVWVKSKEVKHDMLLGAGVGRGEGGSRDQIQFH